MVNSYQGVANSYQGVANSYQGVANLYQVVTNLYQCVAYWKSNEMTYVSSLHFFLIYTTKMFLFINK